MGAAGERDPHPAENATAARPLLAGIDVGSTNCKVGVYTLAGEPVAEQRRPTGEDAEAVVAGALQDLSACIERAGPRPEAVGVTSMAESGVALDRSLRPLHPLLRWDDPRGAGEAAFLAEHAGRDALLAAAGVDVAAKTPLARWLWLRRHRPELLARMRVWVGAADLVVAALTGRPATDPTLAGRTGALDQRSGRYDADLLALAGITADLLPPVRPAGTVAGTVTGAAARSGLTAGTPVVVTGHDHLVAAFAAGARNAGDVADSLGTAEAVVTVTDRPAGPGPAGTGVSWNRHVDGLHWCLVSGFPGSGRLVDWFCSHLLDTGGEDRYRRFESLAASVTARPTGIVVQPYLDGRAAPRPDPRRRLSVHGLGAGHGTAELAVAVLEGACFHVRWMTDSQRDLAAPPAATQTAAEPPPVYVLGGPTRSRAWMRIKADAMPQPIRTVQTADAACAGAALLAGRAAGACDPPPVLASVAVDRDEERAAGYQALYRDGFLPLATRDEPGPGRQHSTPTRSEPR